MEDYCCHCGVKITGLNKGISNYCHPCLDRLKIPHVGPRTGYMKGYNKEPVVKTGRIEAVDKKAD